MRSGGLRRARPCGPSGPAASSRSSRRPGFAFFRDGAVFEFGGTEVLDQEKILPIMGQFGGTRGPVVEDASSLDKRADVKWSRKSSMPNGLAVPA